MNNNKNICIAFVGSESDNKPIGKVLEKDKFIELLTQHKVRAKKSGPGFIPAVFTPGTGRKNANVEQLTALVLDVDDGTPYETLLEKVRPFEHVYYTSHSHHPEHPKYRIVIFLDKPIPAAEWPFFWQRAANHFGHLDPATKDASRLYFLPAHPAGSQCDTRYAPGRLLKVDDLEELPLMAVQITHSGSVASTRVVAVDIGIEANEELSPEAGLDAVVQRCTFMQRASNPNHQNTVSEPHWMALISNACRFENSDAWIHAASEYHDDYDEAKTQAKIDRLRENYGPVSCTNIQQLGFSECPPGGCLTCKGQVVSAPAGLWGWLRQDRMQQQVEEDLTNLQTYEIGPFSISDMGIVHTEFKPGQDPKHTQVTNSRVDVIALGRDSSSVNWGLMLSFINLDGVRKTWTMPMEMLAGARQPFREVLLSMGVYLCPNKRAADLFAQYLMEASPDQRVLTVDSIGWHGNVFVLPEGVYGIQGDERVVLQLADPSATADFVQHGTMQGWQDTVARLANGNPRLMLAIALSLSGPVIPLLQAENVGFNLRGPSSIGKSLALKAASSVWSDIRFMRTWNATGNGLQSVAATYNHTFLPLDEMGEAQASSIGSTVFALGGGVGRTRARINGDHREAKRWQLSYLSTSERSLGNIMTEAGQQVVAGQEVRLIEIPADAGVGFGIFNELHGYSDSRRLAEALQAGILEHHGHAGVAWIQCLADPDKKPDILRRIRAYMATFIDQVARHGDAGQVSRVANRFAIIAGVGAVCCEEGILPWRPDDMLGAMRSCMSAWLDHRGGRGEMERETAVSIVREFLMRHGSSRFERDFLPGIEPSVQRVINRAGYTEIGEDQDEVFYISSDVYRSEVCSQMDSRQVTRYLSEAGYLVPAESQQLIHRNRKLGDRKSFYAVRGSIMAPTVLQESEEPEVISVPLVT